MNTKQLTYPTVVGHRIVECTAEEQEAIARRNMTHEERIADLCRRVSTLETILHRMQGTKT